MFQPLTLPLSQYQLGLAESHIIKNRKHRLVGLILCSMVGSSPRNIQTKYLAEIQQNLQYMFNLTVFILLA